MGGVNVDSGGKGGRRSLDTEINMIPMIDLLMVTISFLLITAVWVQSSRIDANANVPGPAVDTPPCTDPAGVPCKPEARLHVQTTDPTKFTLVWKEGATVVRTAEVPREASRTKIGKDGKTIVAFPALAARIDDEWKNAGVHRDPSDKAFDHAVVHAGNDMPYGEIVAVMDAVQQPKRPLATPAGKTAQTSAFEMTFATD
jgi:biopolymer transport protein ExbD